MKQALLFCLLGLAASTAIAQPTLTAATSVPTAGINLRMLYTDVSTTSVSGNSGANQTWDLSGLSFTNETDTLNYHLCGGSDDCGRYPSTTIVSSYPQSNGVYSDYYAASSTVLMRLGNKDSVSGTAFNHIFTNPQDILRFPMTYNSGFVDSFAVTDTATNGSTTHYRRGNDTVASDGWGTLKTPSGTFTNVLRVKELINERDSSYRNVVGVTITTSRYQVYTWYDAAHQHALAQTTEYVFSPGSVQAFSSYADVPGTATGVSHTTIEGIAIGIAPNPARGNATLSIRLNAGHEIDVAIINMMGQVVYQSAHSFLPAGENKLALKTQGLPAGVYTIRVNAGGKALTGRLVIE